MQMLLQLIAQMIKISSIHNMLLISQLEPPLQHNVLVSHLKIRLLQLFLDKFKICLSVQCGVKEEESIFSIATQASIMESQNHIAILS
jgi:hypothetical protein